MRNLSLVLLCALLFALVVPSMLAVPSAHAQECDARDYVAQISDDLETYNDRMKNLSAEYSDLGDLYLDLMQTRYQYEDQKVCEDLLELKGLVLQQLSTWQDGAMLLALALADPDNATRYSNSMSKDVVPRNGDLTEAILEAAQEALGQ